MSQLLAHQGLVDAPAVEAPALPASHRRLLQVLAVAWLFTGQSVWWPSPAGAPFGWSIAFALLSTGACALLAWGRFPRAAAAGLAALIVLELLAVPTWFAHNRLFVASLLVMTALSTPRLTWLPRAQVALVYGVAAVDKLLSAPWRDGRFFGSFVEELGRFGLLWAPGGTVGAPNPLASWLAAHGSPASWTGLSWAVIALELGLAFGFAVRARWALWPNLVFHACVFSLTGSPMGQFFFAGSAVSLLLLDDDVVPPVGGLMVTTLVLAGPWTHRALPWAALLFLALDHRRRLSRRGRPGP